MKTSFAVLVVLIILIGIPASGLELTRSASAQSPVIVVHVTDQYGNWYNGANVQVWQQAGPLLYQGSVQNGYYTSGALNENSNYVVIVSSSTQSQNQSVYLASQNLYLNFTLFRPSPTKPQLIVQNISFTPSVVTPGIDFTVHLSVINTGSLTAYNSLLVLQALGTQISVIGSSDQSSLGELQPNQTINVNFQMRSFPNAQAGPVTVTVQLSYTDIQNTPYNSTSSFVIPLSAVPTKPQLIVQNISFTPSVVTPGIDFTVHLSVINTGSLTAYNSLLVLQALGTQISVIGSSDQSSLGELQPNQTINVNFQMQSDPHAQAGSVVVALQLSYTDIQNTPYNSTSSFVIPLSAVPTLQVGQFTLNPFPLTPGISSLLSLEVDNVGGSGAYNVSLTLSGPKFLTNNPSYYLGAIQSDGSSKASFYIAVANSTLAGTYNLAVIATCQDSTGYRYSTSSNFSVTVESYSPPAVVITNVLVSPPVLTPGSSGSVTIFVKNTGTTEASNVVIQILGGSGIVSTDTFGLGTIEPGAQVTQVIGLNVIPGIKAGGYNMSFSATFTDPTGKVFHSSVPLQITVYKAPSLFTPLTIGALAVVVVVAMTSLFFLRRTKRF